MPSNIELEYAKLETLYEKLKNESRQQNSYLEDFKQSFCERSGLPVEDMQTVPSMTYAILKYLDFLRDRFFVQSHAKRAVENINPPSLAIHHVVNSLEKEIDSLKSELEQCHAEIDGYQKTLQTLEKPKYQMTINPDGMFDRGAVKHNLTNLRHWIINRTSDRSIKLDPPDVVEVVKRIEDIMEKVL